MISPNSYAISKAASRYVIFLYKDTNFTPFPAYSSPHDQKLVKESAVKAGEEQRAWFLENDEAKIAEYEEKGYTVTRPTDIDAWKEKVAPVYDKMYAAHPTWEGLVEMVRAAK